jgi:pimeloyl-ACP methyl ester carboxylesterase
VLINFEYEELFFENDGIRLHAVAAGPLLGPVVVLLHGFPEFWYGWRKQIGPLGPQASCIERHGLSPGPQAGPSTGIAPSFAIGPESPIRRCIRQP